MNYHHAYHAGSATDVFKHIILTALIEHLQQKNTPFCYIDTHAGIGEYDLSSIYSQKTKEADNGILKLIQAQQPPQLVKEYLDVVHKINNQLAHAKFASLQYYPGSPMIARQLARPNDRIIACELHPEDYQLLKNVFMGDKQVAIHHLDGFTGLKAFLPPKERRGIILIDPPYEDTDEFNRIAKSLEPALKRFATGVYAIWYPIKEKQQVLRFHQSLQQYISQPISIVELCTYPDLPQHLNGSGMAIINPPWQFNESITEILPWVWKALSINGQGEYRTFSLK